MMEMFAEVYNWLVQLPILIVVGINCLLIVFSVNNSFRLGKLEPEIAEEKIEFGLNGVLTGSSVKLMSSEQKALVERYLNKDENSDKLEEDELLQARALVQEQQRLHTKAALNSLLSNIGLSVNLIWGLLKTGAVFVGLASAVLQFGVYFGYLAPTW